MERLENWRPPQHLLGQDVTFYAEVLFVEVMAAALGLSLFEAPADWLTSLPERYLRRRVRFTTLEEARANRDRLFVKPADGKSFPAGVYESGEALPPPERLEGATSVLVSDVVGWEVEYRCFVLNRAVAAITPYIRNGELAEAADGSWPALPGEREEALVFATTLLADRSVGVPPAAVIDVGRIRGHGWAVVESNPAWASGICGAEPDQVLPVVSAAMRPKTDVTALEQPWVRTAVEFE